MDSDSRNPIPERLSEYCERLAPGNQGHSERNTYCKVLPGHNEYVPVHHPNLHSPPGKYIHGSLHLRRLRSGRSPLHDTDFHERRPAHRGVRFPAPFVLDAAAVFILLLDTVHAKQPVHIVVHLGVYVIVVLHLLLWCIRLILGFNHPLRFDRLFPFPFCLLFPLSFLGALFLLPGGLPLLFGTDTEGSPSSAWASDTTTFFGALAFLLGAVEVDASGSTFIANIAGIPLTSGFLDTALGTLTSTFFAFEALLRTGVRHSTMSVPRHIIATGCSLACRVPWFYDYHEVGKTSGFRTTRGGQRRKGREEKDRNRRGCGDTPSSTQRPSTPTPGSSPPSQSSPSTESPGRQLSAPL
ncbi:hypothetical protein FA13DRAFT_760996 [Coprinellus micaceus]|uniref:Uncharacterized protein n=1 Tax=Coprinellus micaceus TaxID=71717 RepID=A0A4Y7T491_COPMI|nr:hypothetical protein FA13DRAFT_760996 [Coprinellus micaceus]